MSPKKWEELKEGWGLDEVPHPLREEVGCCMCGDVESKCKLYSEFIGLYNNSGTVREIQIAIDRIRPNCFCRFHAEEMFKEREE